MSHNLRQSNIFQVLNVLRQLTYNALKFYIWRGDEQSSYNLYVVNLLSVSTFETVKINLWYQWILVLSFVCFNFFYNIYETIRIKLLVTLYFSSCITPVTIQNFSIRFQISCPFETIDTFFQYVFALDVMVYNCISLDCLTTSETVKINP